MSKVTPPLPGPFRGDSLTTIDIMRGPILASTSIYRKKLFQDLGVPFDTVHPEIDETPLESENPLTLVKRLAREKSIKISKLYRDRVVIGSDQVAVFQEQILGKPGTRERATALLTAFSGHHVTFLTAASVVARGGRSLWHHVDQTDVQFRSLRPAEIERYIEKDCPLDCAGGFKSEKLGISLFQSIRTQDPTALIGLPLIFVCAALRHYGFEYP